MIKFLKYLAYGLLGLLFHLTWPQLAIQWLPITLAYALTPLGLRKSFGLLILLALMYSSVSQASTWQIALPYAMVLGLETLRTRLFFQQRHVGFAFLMFQLWLADFMVWPLYAWLQGLGLDWGTFPWQSLTLTLVVGLGALPILQRILSSLFRPWFKTRRRSMTQLSWHTSQSGAHSIGF